MHESRAYHKRLGVWLRVRSAELAICNVSLKSKLTTRNQIISFSLWFRCDMMIKQFSNTNYNANSRSHPQIHRIPKLNISYSLVTLMQTRLLKNLQFMTLNDSSKIETKSNIKYLIFARVTVFITENMHEIYITHFPKCAHSLCIQHSHSGKCVICITHSTGQYYSIITHFPKIYNFTELVKKSLFLTYRNDFSAIA